mgnify:FL=1
MKLLNLRDNALFVRNFRERMRTHVVGSYAALLFVIVMIFLLLNKESFAKAGAGNPLFTFIPHYVPAYVLAGMAVFQGFVILVLGTLSAYRMALQDRLNGTLDFFRATPTEGVNHVIGLVLGAPVLEWFFFLLLIPVMLVFALLSDVKPAALMDFYASIILCAVLYHSLGVLTGICATRKKYRATVNVVLLGALIFAGVRALILMKSSVAYHGTFLPGYTNLLAEIMNPEAFPGSLFFNYNLFMFFGKPIPSLLLQALVQAPLCLLACLAIKRKISSPETPIFSRFQLLILTSLSLVYFTGDSLFTGAVRRIKGAPGDFNPVLCAYFYLFFFLSVFFSSITTPTALGYQKGINRVKKLGLSKLGRLDEQNGNSGWLIIFCALSAPVYFALCAVFKVSFMISPVSFAMFACFIVLFANALEFFRLSRFHGKTIVFSTAVLILWVALPVTEAILATMNYNYPFFVYLSPITALALWGGYFTGDAAINSATTIAQNISSVKSSISDTPDTVLIMTILGHLALLALTVVFIVLAARERKHLKAGIQQ